MGFDGNSRWPDPLPIGTVRVPIGATLVFAVFVYFVSALLLKMLPQNPLLDGLPTSLQIHTFTAPLTAMLVLILSRGYVDLRSLFRPAERVLAAIGPVVGLATLLFLFNVTLFCGINVVAAICERFELMCSLPATSTTFGARQWEYDHRIPVAIGLATLAAPFVEEVFFRGLLLSRLAMSLRPATALTLSSIAFCLIHPGAGMLYAFVGGLIFGYVYLVTGSLWLCYWLHAVSNLLSRASAFVVDIEPVSAADLSLGAPVLALTTVTMLHVMLLPRLLGWFRERWRSLDRGPANSSSPTGITGSRTDAGHRRHGQ